MSVRKHPLARCEDCVFQNAPFVPTQNPIPRSQLAVVGEAPGAYEAGRGIPFTGPSGRLLDQVLAHHNYQRSEVMITNVCLCRPTDNADPPKSAIAACKPRLDAELAASGVTKILAVGGTAASALIDPKKKISSLRIGPPKPYIENPEVKVVASWHPAYCLRAPDAFPSFVSDTGKLAGKIYETWVEPNYRVFTDGSTILEVLRRLDGLDGPVVIDIECGVDKDFAYVHPDQYDLLCVGIAYGPRKAVVIAGSGLKEPAIQNAFGQYLARKRIIAHNGKFDLAALRPAFNRDLALWADTMLKSYCLDERPGQHGLKKLGIEVLGTPDWEAAIRRYVPRGGNYADIPKHILYRYNAFDVGVTWDLNEYFDARMGDRERQQHNFLIQASNALMNLEAAGITFDVPYSFELQTLLEDELMDLELSIERTTGRALNPRSPMQIMRWFAERGFMLKTTQADVLEKVLEKATIPQDIRKFIEQLLLHRRRTKLNGTYVKGFQKRIHDGKVFTTYTLHGTTSGRLASKNPNMQNIVRDKRIKHQFTVEHEDNVLIQLDYKQAEGRVITTLARDEYLASIFRDGSRDIFDELTTQIYGKGNWGKEERVKIKSVFYGLSYGRGAESIGVELGMPINEAKELLANFKALIPATVSWQASVTHRVLSGEDLITPYGRKRSFWLITEQNRADVINEALSFLPQSIASDICLTALIALQPQLRGLATTRLTIHDALILESKEVDAEQVIDLARTAMVNSGEQFTDFVPFVVDVSQGKRWSEL
jgi:uracil-DNA glycosylase family 4